MKKLIENLRLIDFKHHNLLRYTLFILWSCIVIYLVSKHVFWRDEVRALSLALQGNNLVEFFEGLHGEGHPALWYLMLRLINSLIHAPQSLPILAFIVAFASFMLLVFRSPFNLLLIMLIVMSNFALYEYSVMARNYGISMLILFIIAVCYEKYRNSGVVLGLLLFLLANCNVHSVILAGSFLMFWLFDSLSIMSINRHRFFRFFSLNTFIVAIGVVICFVTIYPPFNDAAMSYGANQFTLKAFLSTIFFPGYSMDLLTPKLLIDKYTLLSTALLYGSTLVLIKRPSALISTCVTLIVFSCFFRFIYPGGYRHQALWLVFLISMYWISLNSKKHDLQISSDSSGMKLGKSNIQKLGYIFFIILLIYQVWIGPVKAFAREIKAYPNTFNSLPQSRSFEFAKLINNSPEYKDAIIVADPDFLLEPLHYYLKNSTYLMREQRFGKVVVFTKNAILHLSLADVMRNARALKMKYGKPVLILLKEQLDSTREFRLIKEGYNWELLLTPEQIEDFMLSTKLIARYGPALSDESFDVYLLK